MAAWKVLDKRPFNDMFLKKLKAMQHLTMEVDQGSSLPSYNVFPIEHTKKSAETLQLLWSIILGTRCMCHWRIASEVQCEHELLVDNQFIEEQWNSPWYNDRHWDQGNNCRSNIHLEIPNIGDALDIERHVNDSKILKMTIFHLKVYLHLWILHHMHLHLTLSCCRARTYAVFFNTTKRELGMSASLLRQ